jgi:dinuclear metal center YbgI/SA1388 family protein
MVTLAGIIEIADSLFPFKDAEQWDNCGLQIGDLSRVVQGIAFGLDPTPQTVAFAAERSCELLITHHPVLIEPVRSISCETLAGRTLLAAARSRVDIVALHTSFDAAHGGLNDWIAARLGLTEVFIPVPATCARMGTLLETMPALTLAEKVAADLGTAPPRVICSGNAMVEHVFCASGSGMGYLAIARQYGADAMVTGDVRYHSAREALELGMPVIDGGHFGLERHAPAVMAGRFRVEFTKMGLDVTCFACDVEADPYAVTYASQGGRLS